VHYKIRKHHATGRIARVRKSQKAELVGVGAAYLDDAYLKDGREPGLSVTFALDDDKQRRSFELTIQPDDCADPLIERLLQRLHEMVQDAKIRKDRAELEARRSARRRVLESEVSTADTAAHGVERAARALRARRFRHADYPRASYAYFAPETRSWWAATTEIVEHWAVKDDTAEELPRQISREWATPEDPDDE
jgi:hypothetical protein